MPTQGTGLPTRTPARAEERVTVELARPGPSTEIRERREDTHNPAGRLEPDRARLAATAVADRQEAIRRAEGPA